MVERMVSNSDKYEYRGNWDNANMFGWFEEHLNYYSHAMLENDGPDGMHLDLLIPVKDREKYAQCDAQLNFATRGDKMRRLMHKCSDVIYCRN